MARAIEVVRSRGITRAHRGRGPRGRANTRPLIVLSACAGVTNELIRIGELSLKENTAEALAAIDRLEARHARIARELLSGEERIEHARQRLHTLWEELRTLAKGINLLRELTPRSRDQVQSMGERASSLLFHAALSEQLEEEGTQVHLFDARDFFLTTNEFTAARPITSEITRRMKRIRSALVQGAVGVTQGFIGKTLAGEVTTIGRGGSDFSAAIMGVALGSSEIQIWTDVAGIMTCDPRIVPDARTIERISFREASELAFHGAKVLHPETIWPAVEQGIPVLVLSSKEPEKAGTIIIERTEEARPLTGIAVKRSIVLARLVSASSRPNASGLRTVWEALAESGAVPLAVSVSVDSAAYAFGDLTVIPLLRSTSEGLATLEVEHDRALITLVGSGLHEQSGIAARIFRVLGKTNCEMISYGGSQTAISLVVKDEVANRIVKRLHGEFF